MSKSILQRRAEIQGLATAILLPSVGVFGGPIGPDIGQLGPLASVVGIGLFQRTVLTLQRAGIRQLIVLSGSEEEQLKLALGKGPRVTIPVRWMPTREFPLDDPRTWESLAAEVHGFALVASINSVFSRELIEQLRRDVRDGQSIVVAQSRQDQLEQPMMHGVSLTMPSGRSKTVASTRLEESTVRVAELVVVPASLMSAANQAANEKGSPPIRQWIERAAADGRVRVVTAEAKRGTWYQEVRTLSDVDTAENKLYNSLKGEFEGFVDRYFNRKLSRWFTRLFLAIGLSPNSITALAGLIGLVAAAGFGLGTYSAGVVAAVLFQLAAVIDCCDGEVARLTFTESPFGAWLDLVLDNIVHMAIFAGIAVGLYTTKIGQDDEWVPLALGVAAVVGNAVSFFLVEKAQKIKTMSGWKSPAHAAWADTLLRNVASRDFSAALLGFALFDQLYWFLIFAAAGSLLFAGAMVWVIRPSSIAVPRQ
ncbi:MAG: CDP-alcohol phosphatidyltransferase family protein [Nitrospira sp.]|nr:CDP-alcohol phosphatidyltransferase family protein [Nitrospira sp.]MDH4371307.1 CDP-alcohol phosphatidyltransferase family protein [Nitrospira sp.]MDH5498872.1 CDP-alcohol phosphatidyltransferase family protein [Nitrospira sp.]MDH5725854.1 CDP-alcohol phosphatidyltransferase family protein [Nitrospira sp.]